MNKLMYPSLVAIGVFSLMVFPGLPDEAKGAEQELRPTQKIMRARDGWVKAMQGNLGAMNFEAVKNDALALSSQATSVAEKQPEGLAKELTMRLSSLAAATAEAAGTKNGDAVKTKLAEVQATCAECHAKIRDKK